MDPPPGVTPEQYSRWQTQEEVRSRLLSSFRRIPPATVLLLAALGIVHLVTGADDWLCGRMVGAGRQAALYDVLLGSRSPEGLVAWGANAYGSVASGEHWRLPASVFLHADVLHIGLNGVALFGLGRLCEAVFGPGRFLALFLASGIAGATLTHLGGTDLSVGASGGVFGLMGAGVVFGRRFRTSLPPSVRPIFGRGLVPWIFVNILIGLSVPRIDNLGHMGGLLGGALLALILGSPVVPGAEGYRRTPVILAFGIALCLGWTLAGMIGHRF
ncbi:MAG: rhomboid family intramembrane serine protease [Deltaproteobacteria bacterium]|nr:rhomboid family intramembrane serine protease [Deltaproteobacteria bacterium]